jgi:hypothetical protein
MTDKTSWKWLDDAVLYWTESKMTYLDVTNNSKRHHDRALICADEHLKSQCNVHMMWKIFCEPNLLTTEDNTRSI